MSFDGKHGGWTKLGLFKASKKSDSELAIICLQEGHYQSAKMPTEGNSPEASQGYGKIHSCGQATELAVDPFRGGSPRKSRKGRFLA